MSPSVIREQIDITENITFPQTTCADGNKNKRDDPIVNCCFQKTFYFQVHLYRQFDNFLREKLIFSEHAHPMGLSVIWETGTVWRILEPHHSNSLPDPPRDQIHTSPYTKCCYAEQMFGHEQGAGGGGWGVSIETYHFVSKHLKKEANWNQNTIFQMHRGRYEGVSEFITPEFPLTTSWYERGRPWPPWCSGRRSPSAGRSPCNSQPPVSISSLSGTSTKHKEESELKYLIVKINTLRAVQHFQATTVPL